MKTNSLALRRALLALGCALGFAFASLPSAHAVDAVPRADAKTLPVTTSIEKSTPGEHGGPFTLVVKNTSHGALKVSAVIDQSITSHNRPKKIELPAHSVAAGESWKIADLAVDDKVTLSAEGYDKLEVVVKGAH